LSARSLLIVGLPSFFAFLKVLDGLLGGSSSFLSEEETLKDFCLNLCITDITESGVPALNLSNVRFARFTILGHGDGEL